MAGTIVFIHSPLAGPTTWLRLEPLCSAHRWNPIVVDLRAALAGSGPIYPELVRTVVGQVLTRNAAPPLALVGHSGAGALLPALANALGSVRSVVFVDALLPHPGRSWFETAPSGLTDFLRSRVREGHLPPWDKWWPEGTIDKMIRDPSLAHRLVEELPEVPLRYLEERAPLDALSAGASYLALSEAYAAEAERARAMQWPVERLQLNHLGMLTDPEPVLAAIERLMALQS
ncbi:MAG: alpha/beta fold hydrolase [Alphaproteobacteria bacterium]|nr:alpha/beta fold hydrolase [Alphaproteobacteria bacterium]